jgi:hypothetical protein
MLLTAINDIPTKQNRPHLLALLRARKRTYKAAKLTQGVFVLLTIALPVVSVFLAPDHPHLKPYLALAALALLLVDTGIIERLQKDRMKRGAKLQEAFDADVLSIPWNRFVVGARVDPEDVHSASARLLTPKREAELLDWYATCVGEIPLPVARLICQRTNISYDARLRQRYGGALLLGTVALGLLLMIVGLAFDLNFSELLLTVLVPFTPVFSWALREHRKQADTASALMNLKSECEKLWDTALNGGADTEIACGSRELQDAIYQHRVSSPLVFDWVYNKMRRSNEDEANHAAGYFVAQAKAAMAKEAVA